MNELTWENFETWVRQENGIGPKKILSEHTRLQEDLDITGDEAADFMENFFSKFSVDRGDYNLSRYFSEEGFNPLSLLFSKKKRIDDNEKTLFLRMLYQAALDGRWNCEKLKKMYDKK